MEVIDKQIAELTPYAKNPRKNDQAVDAVAASIKEFGFKVPIVIDSDGVIVAGHTRLKAALLLGLETVPCVVADDLTEEQIKAFRLADNKTSELAEWDYALLDEEIAELTDIDMSLFGFDTQIMAAAPEIQEDPEEELDIEKLEKHYGVPYQGNKSRIADIIINLLPAGKRLVDLFGGVERSLTAPCSRENGIASCITI